MKYSENFILGFNQLLIHVFVLLLIETFIFYVLIKNNTQKNVNDGFKQMRDAYISQINDKGKMGDCLWSTKR